MLNASTGYYIKSEMLEYAPYYFSIYWWAVMLLTISKYSSMQSLRGYAIISQRDDYKPIIVFSIFFVLFFGFRPVSNFFGDTVVYNSTYNLLQRERQVLVVTGYSIPLWRCVHRSWMSIISSS